MFYGNLGNASEHQMSTRHLRYGVVPVLRKPGVIKRARLGMRKESRSRDPFCELNVPRKHISISHALCHIGIRILRASYRPQERHQKFIQIHRTKVFRGAARPRT